MQLGNEGAIQTAPILPGAAEEVSQQVQRWDGVQAVTHWQFGNSRKGAEFHVDDEELGHVHLNGEVHLLPTKELSKALILNGLAEKVSLGEEWVKAFLTRDVEKRRAVWLFTLGYDRLRAADEKELQERISAAPC